MCFITNPTKQQLDSWFKCNKLIGKYLEVNLHIPMIYCDKQYYYFVNNELLKEVLDNLPLYLKIVKLF